MVDVWVEESCPNLCCMLKMFAGFGDLVELHKESFFEEECMKFSNFAF